MSQDSVKVRHSGLLVCESLRSYPQVATVRQYVVNQKEHHCRMDFAKEFKLLAKKHGFEIGIEANPQVGCGVPRRGLGFLSFPALPCRALDSSVPSGTGLRKIFMVGRTGPLLEAYTKGPPCRSNGRVIEAYVSRSQVPPKPAISPSFVAQRHHGFHACCAPCGQRRSPGAES